MKRLDHLERIVAEFQRAKHRPDLTSVRMLPREVEHIIKVVSMATNVPRKLIISRRRDDFIFIARAIVFSIWYSRGTTTLKSIGNCFSCDHGTVLNAIKRVAERRKIYPAFEILYSSIVGGLEAEKEKMLVDTIRGCGKD